ncbi:MAG: dihydroneopterin aldolase [Tannerellaceae bacterium]|jgi:dihydroneopterin aldolase|nr:dihydroneopterin aldolase [Tannerellaceae bacterium]
MTTEIQLRDVRFHAFHGVSPQEQLTGNLFTIDICLTAPLHKAVASDNPDDTINYAEVYRITAEEMAIPSLLLEHAAGRIMSALKRRFPQIEALEISLAKLNPPIPNADMHSAAIKLSEHY